MVTKQKSITVGSKLQIGSKMNDLQLRFHKIKRQFFRWWDREDFWRISGRSKRNVQGHCDVKNKVIEIVLQSDDPEELDGLIIHEICHAVSGGGHGKVWQRRMERAAKTADKLGRQKLAGLLRQEIVNYQDSAEGIEQAYQTIQDWITHEPDLTLAQVKQSLADQHGLLVSEVEQKFRRFRAFFSAAKAEALEARTMKRKWLEANGSE